MSATSILIQVGATTASAIRELDKVNAALDGQKTGGDKWGKGLKAAGALAATGIAAAGAAALVVGKQFLDMGMMALEDEQSVQRLNETLGKIPGITQQAIDANSSWVDSMQIATLYADTALRQSVADLALATGDLTKAQELTALAADLATTKNISLEAATKILTKATAGSTGKLEDWGLVVDENKDGVISLDEVTKGLTKTVGGAAEAAANQKPWERIQVIWGEIQEALGTFLIPIMERLGDWFKSKENQKKIQEFIDQLSEMSRVIGEKVVVWIDKLWKYLQSEEGQKSLKDVTEYLKDLVDMLKATADWLEKNAGKFSFLFKLVSNPPLKGIIDRLQDLVDILKDVWNWVGNVISKLGGIRVPSWLANLNPFSVGASTASYGATTSTMSAGASTRSTNTYKVYVEGTGNPYKDAKIIKRALESQDRSQGRQPGQRLAVAW